MSLELPPSLIDAQAAKFIQEIVGSENLSLTVADRRAYARDTWPRSLMWLRDGHLRYAPDAVVWPRSAREILALFEFATARNLPVIPYGAGSGVCAGALPLRGGLILDLKKMNRLFSVQPEDLTVEAETGIIGQDLEQLLNHRGYTMGHFPSSIYCSTLGGYLAARSAGQMSSKYGKIEDMVLSLEVVVPRGEIYRSPEAPLRGAWPDLNQLFVGSEGTLGIFTRARLRIHPLPPHRAFLSFKFPEVSAGLAAMREIMQAGIAPSVLRLYDEYDTMVFHATDAPEEIPLVDALDGPSAWKRSLSGVAQGLKRSSLGQALKFPRLVNKLAGIMPGGCLLVIVLEGEADNIPLNQQRCREYCLKHRGADQGETPARAWYHKRYAVSYKQSRVFDAGAFVDTMEVAAPWAKVHSLYQAVRQRLAPRVFIMAHFSHAYPDGCCIYFSLAGMADTAEASDALYQKTWEEALTAVHEHGGTISHHHGVGWHKAGFMAAEQGELMNYYRRLKTICDPAGILNPGKMGLE